MSLLRVAGTIGESEEGGEGAVVWRSLPTCEHDFLGKGFRPSGVLGVPLVARASPVAASLGRGVERRQGGELGQLALVEFISVLQECKEKEEKEGQSKNREENMLLVEYCGGLSESRWRYMEETLLSSWPELKLCLHTFVHF